MIKYLILFILFFQAQAIFFTSENKAMVLEKEYDSLLQVSYELWNQFLNDSEKLEFKNYTGEAFLDEKTGVVFLKLINTKTGHIFRQYFNQEDILEPLDYQIHPTGRSIYLEKLKQVSKIDAIAEKNLDLIDNPQLEKPSSLILNDIEAIYLNLLKIWEEKKEEKKDLGLKEFRETIINRKKITFHDTDSNKGFGRLIVHKIPLEENKDIIKENTKIVDGFIYIQEIRIIHTATEAAIKIFERDTINTESKYYKEIAAKEHISSGENRFDKKGGRDFMHIEVESFSEDMKKTINKNPLTFNKNNIISKFPAYSKEWWSEFSQTIIRKPSWSFFSQGIFYTAIQTMVAIPVLHGFNALHEPLTQIMPYSDFFLRPEPYQVDSFVKFTLAWGISYNTFILPSFKNWVGIPSTNLVKTLKYMSTSIISSNLITLSLSGFNPAIAYGKNIADIGMAQLRILFAKATSGAVKTNYQNIARLREHLGMSEGEFKLGPFKTGWANKDVYFNFWYLPAKLTSTLERSNFLFAERIPIGNLFMLASIPLSEFFFMKYAQRVANRTGNKEAIKMAKEARESLRKKFMFFGNSSKLKNKVKVKFRTKAKNSNCSTLLINFLNLTN